MPKLVKANDKNAVEAIELLREMLQMHIKSEIEYFERLVEENLERILNAKDKITISDYELYIKEEDYKIVSIESLLKRVRDEIEVEYDKSVYYVNHPINIELYNLIPPTKRLVIKVYKGDDKMAEVVVNAIILPELIIYDIATIAISALRFYS